MTIAIIGSGHVGSALAGRVAAAGGQVVFGSRHPGAAPSGGAATRSIPDAVAEAQVVLLAVPSAAAVEAIGQAGDVAGKIIVDCTNPVRWDGGPVWTPPAAGSVAQAIAAAAPGAHVIKGFNHFGAEIQAAPTVATGPVDAMFAGDNAEAKQVVMDLARRMGFRPHDAGPLRNAAVLENLAVLWIHLATAGGLGRQFTFQIVNR